MKYKKLFFILTIVIIFFAFINNVCYGIDTDVYKPSALTEGDYEYAYNFAKTIIGALQIIGVFIAVVGMTIIGIKYMMGSASEKAEYKKTMMPYIIGCIMIFALPQLLAIIYDLISKM